VTITRQEIIAQIRKELGNCEDTEHLIDWLEDLWATFEVLTDRFGEGRAIQVVTAQAPLPQESKREAVLI
jgi:hypothetical protein